MRRRKAKKRRKTKKGRNQNIQNKKLNSKENKNETFIK